MNVFRETHIYLLQFLLRSVPMISLSDVKSIHFVGIGGISMSGLAQILLESGYQVSGSDINESHIISKLQAAFNSILFN
jgi:UDP-N-acetylmuramate-alanine ligase